MVHKFMKRIHRIEPKWMFALSCLAITEIRTEIVINEIHPSKDNHFFTINIPCCSGNVRTDQCYLKGNPF